MDRADAFLEFIRIAHHASRDHKQTIEIAKDYLREWDALSAQASGAERAATPKKPSNPPR